MADLNDVSKALALLMARAESAPFHDPVDWKGMSLWDYPRIIKTPMDLNQCQSKCDSNAYQSPAAMAADIRLVFENCKEYNADGSEYYVLADKLLKWFEEKCGRIRLTDAGGAASGGGGGSGAASSGAAAGTDDGAAGSDRPPTVEERTKFSYMVYRIKDTQLGEVVTKLEHKCPGALTKNKAEDEIEINVDAIDNRSFHEVHRFVRECVPDSGKKNAKKKTKQEAAPASAAAAAAAADEGGGGDGAPEAKRAKTEA